MVRWKVTTNRSGNSIGVLAKNILAVALPREQRSFGNFFSLFTMLTLEFPIVLLPDGSFAVRSLYDNIVNADKAS